jgi:Nif-specific regulatory protein
MDELERLRRERDLYLRLLDLGDSEEIERFLQEALACIVALTGAEQAYLELCEEREAGEPLRWGLGHGCAGPDLERIRSSMSRGIIAEALATGETISTHSALLDGRFRDRESVRRERIEAVLCAPVGGDPARGVVYLQGRPEPGPFSEADRAAAERFARHLAPLADSLLVRRRASETSDPTRALRARYRLEGIVGRSPALACALEQAMLAAPVDVNVLLSGESGTGKSQLARAIHDNSPRARGPFVELNCSAIPATLVESEFFGARAGAHAEARRDRPGKVAAAEGGTLFLDEVAELPPESQAKLLHLLQARTYYPLGATQPVRADVRIVAATNVDLDEAVRTRRLREDLYYRLQVLAIRMPSLRERLGDVPEVARAVCRRIGERHRFPLLELSPGAVAALEAAEWPGNVRQLENALEGAVIRAAGEGALRVEARHVFPERAGALDAAGDATTFQEATRRFQRDLLERALHDAEWNVAEVARRLDLARSHVYNLVRAFGLSRSDEESASCAPASAPEKPRWNRSTT